MARIGEKFLDTNDRLPRMELNLVSGKPLNLPEDLGDGYTVLFFYRGYW